MSNETNSDVSVKPSTPLNQEQNKSFDMSGIVSAIIPLVITALIFMIGWAYELIWYSFFGVSPSQISIPVPLILAQSLPAIFVALTIILLGFFVYICISFFFSTLDVGIPYVFNLLTYLIGRIWEKLASVWAQLLHRPLPTSNNYVFTRLATQKFVAKLEWALIIGSILLITMWVSLSNPYRIIFSLITAAPFLLILFIVLLIMTGTLFSILRISRPFSKLVKSNRAWMLLLGVIYYFLIIIMSASMAFSDAAGGKKGILLESIQNVFLVGPRMLGVAPNLEIFCDSQQKTCIYGPFGLITENDKSFFLIKWQTNSQSQSPEFSRDSGLYVIPRSDQTGAYVLMPEISTPSPTETPQITLTSTATAVPTIAMTATATKP